MIKISRTQPPPGTLTSENVAESADTIKEIAKQRKPLSTEFDKHWGKDDVRTALWEMQHHKCCYCERERDKTRESDIEHFRPKAEVTEVADHPGYWWLAYCWENLFFSCRKCNQEYKKNFFPVADEQKRARTENCDLAEEDPYLIDPTQKDPEEHISFDWYEVKSKSDGLKSTQVFATGRTDYG
ncbi:MAG: TIGR02646 family protein, partial [Planctomycetaceae bacterium]|nr:TIGR02646 family protein [Planctomycetaceae bacterium]